MSNNKVEKFGWQTLSPVPGAGEKMVEVVTAEYCTQVEEENANMKGLLSRIWQFSQSMKGEGDKGLPQDMHDEIRQYVEVTIIPREVVIDRNAEGERIYIAVDEEFVVENPPVRLDAAKLTPVSRRFMDLTVRFVNYTPDLIESEFEVRRYTVETHERRVFGLRILNDNQDGTYNCSYDYYMSKKTDVEYHPPKVRGVPGVEVPPAQGAAE